MSFRDYFSDSATLYSQLTSRFPEFIELFVHPFGPAYESIQRGRSIFNDLRIVKEKISALQKFLTDSTASITKIKAQILVLDENISKNLEYFTTTPTGNLYQRKDKELRQLISREPLNGYLGVIRELLEIFQTFVEKQQIPISQENLSLLQLLSKSLLVSLPTLAVDFQKLIDFCLLYTEEAFSKKLKKKAEYFDRRYLLSGPGWNAWLEAQQIFIDIEQLKQSREYQALEMQNAGLQSEKINLQAQLKDLETKITFSEQSLLENKKHEELLLNNLIVWLKD
jgi:hypothetical protein